MRTLPSHLRHSVCRLRILQVQVPRAATSYSGSALLRPDRAPRVTAPVNSLCRTPFSKLVWVNGCLPLCLPGTGHPGRILRREEPSVLGGLHGNPVASPNGREFRCQCRRHVQEDHRPERGSCTFFAHANQLVEERWCNSFDATEINLRAGRYAECLVHSQFQFPR